MGIFQSHDSVPSDMPSAEGILIIKYTNDPVCHCWPVCSWALQFWHRGLISSMGMMAAVVMVHGLTNTTSFYHCWFGCCHCWVLDLPTLSSHHGIILWVGCWEITSCLFSSTSIINIEFLQSQQGKQIVFSGIDSLDVDSSSHHASASNTIYGLAECLIATMNYSAPLLQVRTSERL